MKHNNTFLNFCTAKKKTKQQDACHDKIGKVAYLEQQAGHTKNRKYRAITVKKIQNAQRADKCRCYRAVKCYSPYKIAGIDKVFLVNTFKCIRIDTTGFDHYVDEPGKNE